ncbi:MAG: 23S rRNA (adenine(2503)-C(2))-methyltransferase RlmN [Planctomycetes bacterium]|nr:23S rRNA (adenine(2503)-C(2))-methyltransferase RlmN [Planctomycetota bacterium]
MNAELPQGPLWNMAIEDQENWWKNHFSGPKFRLQQMRDWVYDKAVLNPQGMKNLPPALQNEIAKLSAAKLKKTDHLKSSDGSADKILFKNEGNDLLESVLLRSEKRRTVCMSTQVGCALGCTFCNTGLAGFKRNLDPAEMIEQVLHIANSENERISNIVVMGMGEPMLNYDNLLIALRQINHPKGMNLGTRHITISTSGIKGAILKLAQEPEQWGLAISLHAPDDELRSKLMPINKSFSISELLAEVNEYINVTNRRVSFEYVMLKDTNSEKSHARALAKLLKGMLCHVNLIPYNPVPSLEHEASTNKSIQQFAQILNDAGVPCTIRKEKGQDILAACGQLAHKKKQG